MKQIIGTSIVSLACLFSQPILAQVSPVTAKDPWVRPTVTQQKATGAFMQLTANQDMKLISISTPLASSVEIHMMEMDKDVMKMREIKSLDLPSGKTIELKPGSYHIMMMGLKRAIKEGEIVNLTLKFESKDKKQQTLEVKATAKNINNNAADAHGAHKM